MTILAPDLVDDSAIAAAMGVPVRRVEWLREKHGALAVVRTPDGPIVFRLPTDAERRRTEKQLSQLDRLRSARRPMVAAEARVVYAACARCVLYPMAEKLERLTTVRPGLRLEIMTAMQSALEAQRAQTKGTTA